MKGLGVVFSALLTLAAAVPGLAQTGEIHHKFVQVNGIKMHFAEQGQGPLVILVHGFPELWYNWRHVMPALAAAGYHAVAPDMRGYGRTDAPIDIAAYSQTQAVGDIVGLVHALGYEQAVIIGHDIGSSTAADCAILRPDMFRAVVQLSVPYTARVKDALLPSEANRRRVKPGEQFYITYYQVPGVAEKVMDADPKRTLRMWLYSSSGGVPSQQKARYTFGINETALDGRSEPQALPAWLRPDDLDYFANEFSRTSFRGALNWYRAQDTFWAETPFLVGRQILQPVLFIGGADDPWIAQVGRAGVDNLEKSVPNLWKKVLIPGVGHSIEQEAPTEVSRLILEFLRYVDRSNEPNKAVQ